MLILRIAILLIGAHAYVFLSGFIYHYLEQPEKVSKADSVEKIVEHFLTNQNRPKMSNQDIVNQLRDAFDQDEKKRMRKEFSNLWKCYLFSLSSITTVGNSGLYLQTSQSRLFFIFTTTIGLFLYVCLIHNIAIGLLTIYKSSIDFLFMTQLRTNHALYARYKSYSPLVILLTSYLVCFLALVVTALGALVSAQSYLFGLFVIFDSVLTIGSFSVLAYVHPWNEAGFVISVNLILLMGLSFLYTSIYVTFHFAMGTDFDDLIKYWWDNKEDEGYEIIGQEEDRPFKMFMGKSNGAKHDSKEDFRDGADGRNPFLDEDGEAENSSKENFESLTPAFLQQEDDVKDQKQADLKSKMDEHDVGE